jgi:hypothetical protein
MNIILTNKPPGFSQSCYYGTAGKPLVVTLKDKIVNPSTGLTNPMAFWVSALADPVIVPDTGIAGTIAELTDNVLYASPTAPDGNPIMFTIPAAPKGKYYLQLSTLTTAPAAIMTLSANLGQGKSGGSSEPTVSGATTTIANDNGVSVGSLRADDVANLGGAFEAWENLPSTCGAHVLAGTGRLATITSTGISWAIANFGPNPNCIAKIGGSPGEPTDTANPATFGPFHPNRPTTGVFEHKPGASWEMNDEGGTPFPCPAPGGAAPGPGNGSLPASVVSAWHLTYATDCANVSYPPAT